MRIDLHTHSTASDGTEPPAVVMAQARAAGLDVVALTDHDSTRGWQQAAEAARACGVALVPGIEISCERDGSSVHLLAYLPDPSDPQLLGEFERARESRTGRLRAMVERMSADGIPITYEEVLRQVPEGATAGRPHIADALVRNGTLDSRDDAFAEWLHNDSPYYVAHYAVDPVRAVRLVLAAGGVPVIAHPFARISDERNAEREALVGEMARAGLVGLEANHRDHEPGLREHGVEVAQALGLLVTGSSDYHGTGKLNRLGENTTDPQVLEEIIRRGVGTQVVRP